MFQTDISEMRWSWLAPSPSFPRATSIMVSNVTLRHYRPGQQSLPKNFFCTHLYCTALWPLHPEYSTVGAILTSCTSV